MRAPRAATASEVLYALAERAVRLVVVDGVELVPESSGQGFRVEDMRVRHLLIAAAEGHVGAPVLVTSQCPPAADLPETGVTMIAKSALGGFVRRPITAGTGRATLLEVIASSRRASSGWFLAAALGHHLDEGSFATPDYVEEQLKIAQTAGLVYLERVSQR